jgi:hypothetical protein
MNLIVENEDEDENEDYISINDIKDKETLERAVNMMLKNLKQNEYEINETHQFTQSLNEKYYQSGSHLLNRQVAFALKQTDERLFLSWIQLRSKATDFDYNTIQEMTRFVAKGQSYEAEEGTHDDLMMGLVLFGWMSNQNFFKDLTNNDIRKNLYIENMQRIEDEMLPFAIIDDNNEEMYSEKIIDLENQSFNHWMRT